MAVTAPDPPIELPPTATRRCRHGHDISGPNVFPVQHKNGRTYSACRTCRRAAVRRAAARRRGEPVEKFTPGPLPKPLPHVQRAELWTMLPKPVRDRMAGALMDDEPPDPLVNAVIRRAARKKVWRGLGVHFAVIALVEALIEECRDSRSQRLRLDKVLREALG